MKIKHTSTRLRRTKNEPVAILQKPNRQKLKGVYWTLLNASEETYVEGLARALHWYDSAWEWMQHDRDRRPQIDVATLRSVDKINTLRQRADDSDEIVTKQASLLEALQGFEKIFRSMKFPTKEVAELHGRRQSMAERLFKREERITKIYSRTLEELFSAFKPVNSRKETLHYRVSDAPAVDGTAHKPRWISKDLRTLNYTLDHAKWIFRTVRKEGWLHVINKEVQWLAWVSLAKYDLENDKMQALSPHVGDAIEVLMENIRRYALANPNFARRLVRGRRRENSWNARRRKPKTKGVTSCT